MPKRRKPEIVIKDLTNLQWETLLPQTYRLALIPIGTTAAFTS
ncbi:hypothetical protein X975_12048, partial [Stegodyphus mimosarum]